MNKQAIIAAATTLGMMEESMSNPVKMYKPINYAKQDVWYRKTFSRPQKSRHSRTKRGDK